ncbi:MAG: FAD-dependent oxidoreductase [Dehalococcoidales bacterium]|nr:FAD-dependent oxidoreductase [Dehalococcoidales bacterium]
MTNEQNRTIQEPDREIKVFKEADVVVVGGGPAGFSAAVAASRNGADTVLLERYGHLGGMASGGLVMVIMPMSDGTSQQQIGGICQEVIERLDRTGSAIHPGKEDLGSSDSQLIARWKRFAFSVIEGRIRMSATLDPEALKCVLNDMVTESGTTLLLHSWGVRALVENNVMKGVVFESKSGRQALLGRTVIDATGDGDIFASAGAPYDARMNPQMRSSHLALTFRIGNIDSKKYLDFRSSDAAGFAERMRELEKMGGFTHYISTTREDVIWVNNAVGGLDPLDVSDLSRLEVEGRRCILTTHRYLQKYIPGFENSYILDTASQIGVRSSRRLLGEHVLTEKEIFSGVVFPDTIVKCPDFRHTFSPEHPHWHIPYRSLIPCQINNLLAAGRCFSSDLVANDLLAPIQFCIAMGQAAGTAAALSMKEGVSVRDLDYKLLQKCLARQDVLLP